MCARTFGGADDGAQIVRVAYLVADDDKGRFTALLRKSEDIGNLAVFAHRGKRDDALMRVRPAHEVELASVGLDNDDALFPRL